MEIFVFNSINISIIGQKWHQKLLKVQSAVFYTSRLHQRILKYHFDNELMSFWLESGIKNNAVCFMVFWLPGAIVVELSVVSILLFWSSFVFRKLLKSYCLEILRHFLCYITWNLIEQWCLQYTNPYLLTYHLSYCVEVHDKEKQ